MSKNLITAVVPVFPGTNCEYDTANALKRAGFAVAEVVVRNTAPNALTESIGALAGAIEHSRVVVIPGGFSGGDEPEGSAKFIAAIFRNTQVSDAVHELLNRRDGLILGICNGFQALIKLGLLPFGEILSAQSGENELHDFDLETAPTLTFNHVGRHISKYVTTKICTVNSPWLSLCKVGEEHVLPISHGEGRFVGKVPENQVATRYADNPNGSADDIEGIISLDGRVFGKMAHTERYNPLIARNIYGNKFQPLFESAAAYFA